jgi:UDP-glucose 4-epimerase
MMRLKCLVTGGCGFIGSHLVMRLRSLFPEVYVVDDGSHSTITINRKATGEPYPQVDLETFCSQYTERFDVVFHLAAMARTAAAQADPLYCHHVNATLSLALLEWILCNNPKARVVMASSNIVYGNPNVYRASKLAMEEYAETYRVMGGLDLIILRLSNVYGPGMRWDDSICLAALRRSAYEKGYIELTGDGEQSRDFTHVRDIVDGLIAAALTGSQGIFDLRSGERSTMRAMAAYFNVPVHLIAPRQGDTQDLRMTGRNFFGPDRTCLTIAAGMPDVLADVPREEVPA